MTSRQLSVYENHVVHYRAEIDGLRALAVIPVILFHAGLHFCRGGFVGVDVFFVISGYLITTLIVTDLAQEQFSIARFYERRARRILPALFLVLAVTIPCALLWLLPTQMQSFSKDLQGVALFSANFSLARQVGYFDAAAELQPLLHTWSLAVEEQFYLLFPWVLVLAWKYFRERVRLLLVVIALLSFCLAEWGSRRAGASMFFLPQMRSWELALGALVALWPARHPNGSSNLVYAQLAGIVGIVLVVAPMVLYGGNIPVPYPGVYALAPTLGTALIIVFATPLTLIGKVLGNRCLVGMGLISYSAYLWHQPLFAFFKQSRVQPPSDGALLSLTGVALILAYLSWRYIERPFRDRERVSRRAIGCFSATGILCFVIVGTVGYQSHGFEQRAKWQRVAAELAVKAQRGAGERYCREHRIASPLGPLVCVIGAAHGEPEGVLWGDSFAGALLHGLNQELSTLGRSYYAVLGVGCVPIEGAWRTAYRQFGCTPDRHRRFIDSVLSMPSVTKIVWVGSFAMLTGRPEFTQRRFDYMIDEEPATPALVKARVLTTLEKLAAAGKTVVLVGDTPRFPYETADYAIKQYFASGGDRSTGVQRISREAASSAMNEADLLAAADRYARVIDGLSLFCDRQWCTSHDAQGRLLFVDNGHLSYLGSERLAREVIRQLLGASSP